MLTVPTQRVFSNPVTTLPRLIHIFSQIAPLEVKNKKNPGKRDSLLIEAGEKASDTSIKGNMEAYKAYEEMLFGNLKNTGGDLYILNGSSPDRSPVNPYRWGVDIFHPMHFVSDKSWLGTVNKLLNIARASRPSATLDDILGNHRVMAGQITDWPGVTVEDDIGIKVTHPYIDEVRIVEHLLGKKKGFGTLEKRLNDQAPKVGNSQYTESVLNFHQFKEFRDSIPDLDINLIEKMGSREAFYEQARRYIQLIREIVINKTTEFLLQSKPENVYLYSMLTSSTTDIWKKASKAAGMDLKLIGGDAGPLGNVNRSAYGELDPSAIRLLEGALMHNYQQRTGHRLQVPYKITIPEKLEIELFQHCPYGSEWNLCNIARSCSGPTDCLTGDEIKLPESDRKVIKEFAIQNLTGYLPIEGIIYLLNQRDNLLGMGNDKWKSWNEDIQGKTLVPLQLPLTPEVKNFDIRASELSYPLDTIDALTKPGEQITEENRSKLEEIDDILTRGTLVHDLMLGGTQRVYQNLLHPEFRMDRKEYTDQEGPERKHLVYYFKPGKAHFDAVEKRLIGLEKKYDVNEMLDLLDTLRSKSPKITVSGHADAATQIYSPDIPLEQSTISIIDVKTSIARNSEPKNIINQLLVYGMAIRQMTERQIDEIYAIPVFTRFNSNRLKPPEERDNTNYGIFMKQRPTPFKIPVNSERMQEMHNRLLELYVAKLHAGLIQA